MGQRTEASLQESRHCKKAYQLEDCYWKCKAMQCPS